MKRRPPVSTRTDTLLPDPSLCRSQITAVLLRQEVADRPLDHAIAMIGELHVGDDFGLEQADGVARDRVAEPRRELLGHRGAADDVARLEDADAQSRAREIKGADEAVVAGPEIGRAPV